MEKDDKTELATAIKLLLEYYQAVGAPDWDDHDRAVQVYGVPPGKVITNTSKHHLCLKARAFLIGRERKPSVADQMEFIRKVAADGPITLTTAIVWRDEARTLLSDATTAPLRRD